MRLKRAKFREDVRLPQSPRFPSNYRNDIEACEGVVLSIRRLEGETCVVVEVTGSDPMWRPWHEVREVILHKDEEQAAEPAQKRRGRPFLKKGDLEE